LLKSYIKVGTNDDLYDTYLMEDSMEDRSLYLVCSDNTRRGEDNSSTEESDEDCTIYLVCRMLMCWRIIHML